MAYTNAWGNDSELAIVDYTEETHAIQSFKEKIEEYLRSNEKYFEKIKFDVDDNDRIALAE